MNLIFVSSDAVEPFVVKLRLLLMNELGVVLIKYFVGLIFHDERFKTRSIADP